MKKTKPENVVQFGDSDCTLIILTGLTRYRFVLFCMLAKAE